MIRFDLDDGHVSWAEGRLFVWAELEDASRSRRTSYRRTVRLEEGFHVLDQLVEDGWQVIYLTAKAEVGEEMLGELGLRCSELETLP